MQATAGGRRPEGRFPLGRLFGTILFMKNRKRPLTSYQAMKHLIGCVDSQGQQLSKQTGKRFTALLVARRRGRH